MGHAQYNYQHYKSKSGFFIVKIQEAFQYLPDWYQKGEVRGKVFQYYYVLRSVMREHPEVRKCLTRCKHCGIFFLTHPRNAGRRDLRCPFGCRQAHRKKSLKERSAQYYRSDDGKKKKKWHNRARSLHPRQPDNGGNDLAHKEPSVQEMVICLDKVALGHIQMVVSLIEKRYVKLSEISKMVEKIMRQHSMVKGEELAYAHANEVQRSP